MQSNDLITKVIEVSDITEKRYETGKQAKIKDQDNLTYNVYEKKQDGSTSAAWASLERIGLGSTIQISFVEQEKEYEGKPYTSRIIRVINEDIGQGMKNALNGSGKGLSGRGGANNASSEVPKDDKWFQQLAYEKCCSLWAGQLVGGQPTDEIIDTIKNGEFWDLFQAIKADGKKRFFDFGASVSASESVPTHEPLPIVDVNGDLANDIPF